MTEVPRQEPSPVAELKQVIEDLAKSSLQIILDIFAKKPQKMQNLFIDEFVIMQNIFIRSKYQRYEPKYLLMWPVAAQMDPLSYSASMSCPQSGLYSPEASPGTWSMGGPTNPPLESRGCI